MIKYGEKLVIFNYLIASTVYFVSTAIWGMTNNIRYAGLLFAICANFVIFLFEYFKVDIRSIRGKDLALILVFAVYLIFASIVVVQKNRAVLSSRVWVQVTYLIIPALYTFTLVNLLSTNVMIKLIKYTFVLTFILYINKIGLANFFSISNWTAISFSQSDSAFESSDFAGVFTISLFYFYWDRFVLLNKNNNRIWIWASVILSILAWKRLSVVFVLLLWGLGKYIDIKAEIRRTIPIITGILFGFITALYTLFVEGKYNPFNLNIYEFTKGRDYILRLWANYGYISYGYGSSYELIHRYLEMDLVQMYLEVGIVAVILFGIVYFYLVKKSFFAYMIMLYEFLNMLTASSLPAVFEWCLILTLIIFAANQKDEYLNAIKKAK